MLDLAGFQLYLTQKGCKSSTIRTDLFLLRRVTKEVSSLSSTTLIPYLLKCHDKGLSNKYLNHFIQVIHLWGRYNNQPDLLQIRFLKENPYVKSVMSDDEIERFLSCPKPQNTNTKHWAKWTLFFAIMAFTGMRPNEVAHLKVDNVDFGTKMFLVEDSKTNEPRFVPIADTLIEKLNLYIRSLKGPYLFSSERGGDHGYGQVFDNVDWHYNFHKRLNILGIARKNLTPYSLRHSFISTLLSDDSIKLFDVKRIVGHRQSATTEHYYAYNFKNLIKTVNKHPICRKSADPQCILESLLATLKSLEIEKDPRFAFKLCQQPRHLSFDITIKDSEHPRLG